LSAFCKGSGGGGREALTADLNITAGAGGDYATIQEAIDYVASIDTQIYNVFIAVLNGTHSEVVKLKNTVGAGIITLTGDNSTPSNVIIDGGFYKETPGTIYILQGFQFKLTSTAPPAAINATNGGSIQFKSCDFNTGYGSLNQISTEFGGSVSIIGAYNISGGAVRHYAALQQGTIRDDLSSGVTITVTGTPAFSQQFAIAATLGLVRINTALVSYSGGATGKRYQSQQNSVINTGGGGANFFPGNVAGTTITGGIYT